MSAIKKSLDKINSRLGNGEQKFKNLETAVKTVQI